MDNHSNDVTNVPATTTHTTIEEKLKEAQVYIDSGLLPSYIKKPETALIIIQHGKELGIEHVQALNNIYVVGGKPALSGGLMAALVAKGKIRWQTLQDFEPVKTVVDEKEKIVDYVTTIRFVRDGMEETVSYRLSEAKQAGLTTKDNWQKFTRNMMYWRCFSLGARRVAPDLIINMYLASELSDFTHGAPPIVDTEDGEIKVLD